MSETISRAETIYNDTLERIGKERDFYKKHVDSGSFGKESIFKIVLEATERIDREYDIGNITEENRNELIRKLQLETSKKSAASLMFIFFFSFKTLMNSSIEVSITLSSIQSKYVEYYILLSF